MDTFYLKVYYYYIFECVVHVSFFILKSSYTQGKVHMCTQGHTLVASTFPKYLTYKKSEAIFISDSLIITR
jgi:hypothetical protein